MIGGFFFAGHDDGRVQIAVGGARENAAIGQPQPLYPDHPAFRVHHSQRIILAPHPCRAAGMERAFGMFADKTVQRGNPANPVPVTYS